VHPDVETLLALQADDAALGVLQERRQALVERLQNLDRQRQFAADALARARAAVDAEERRQRELQSRIGTHRQMHDRNLAQFDAVKKQREANAAMAQAELTRKVLADDESEMQSLARRVADLRQAAAAQESALADLDAEQEGARAEIDAAQRLLDEQLQAARGRREATSRAVARPLLARYDRIRSRLQTDAVYALRGPSCGNCDTAIPLQRRHQMAASGAVEVCEACGVLLYATN
jgi:predicted  nucleic acid-binding Zn-ribbon protein